MIMSQCRALKALQTKDWYWQYLAFRIHPNQINKIKINMEGERIKGRGVTKKIQRQVMIRKAPVLVVSKSTPSASRLLTVLLIIVTFVIQASAFCSFISAETTFVGTFSPDPIVTKYRGKDDVSPPSLPHKRKSLKHLNSSPARASPTHLKLSTHQYQSSCSCSRRQWVQDILGKTVSVASIATAWGGYPAGVTAKTATTSATVDPLVKLRESQETLDTLLKNWKRATVDCTFAEVPRELLEQQNKELLLEKASTFALFDKSVSVETCKTTNRVVRDYLGVTNKGPLVQIMKTLQSSKALDLLQDPDDLDVYLSEVESFGQALANATSLSYTAGTADLNSVNTFSKEQSNNMKEGDDDSNLEQARKSIVEMKMHLDKVLELLTKEEVA
jgi:hypothetical protein